MVRKLEEFKGDSYVVDVLPLAKTAPFPAIFISRRKKERRRGELALEPGEFLEISSHDFDPPNIDETARRIGIAILDSSEIVRDYIGRRL